MSRSRAAGAAIHFGPAARAAAQALVALVIATPAAAALDMAETLREVVTAHPTLAVRAAEVDAARRRVGPAGAWPAPMVEAGVMNVPTSGSFDTDPMTMKTIGLEQTVPVFGANGRARRSARAAVAAAEAGAEQTRFDLLGAAWQAYADAYYAARLSALAATHHVILDRMVEAARVRYETGHGRLEDVLRSQAEQASLDADLAMFRAEARAARARLDALRGVAAGAPAGADSLAAPPDVTVPESTDPWLAALTDAHPRLRGQTAEIERWRQAAGAERRRTWPDLELRGSYGRREAIMGVPQDNMFSASVGFTLPLFAGNRSSQAGEMDAMARASEAERRAADLDLRAGITEAHAEALGARSRAALIADTVIVTQRRALEAAWSAYRAGGGDMWRVFESTTRAGSLRRAHRPPTRTRRRPARAR
ncbi:MAG: TolC family protein [Candidatus Eisenbacteria bacterium]|uniref:TolC family protein n=1 Tax=Eiseniibacteriota bacterium TaxID=2212470 RepID=A0A9D6L6Z4_UNCEI|nr:TolC family protein [Candidatus Eisenbacteria bacterium]